MSQVWMSHATHIDESCHTHEWVMSHTWISHVPHISMSHAKHMNESCHTYEGVMSHIWAHTNKSRHMTSEGVMSHVSQKPIALEEYKIKRYTFFFLPPFPITSRQIATGFETHKHTRFFTLSRLLSLPHTHTPVHIHIHLRYADMCTHRHKWTDI